MSKYIDFMQEDFLRNQALAQRDYLIAEKQKMERNKKEGRLETIHTVIRNLSKTTKDIAFIANTVELPIDEVSRILKEMN